MQKTLKFLFISAVILLTTCNTKSKTKVSFSFDVQPIFNNNCFSCHISDGYTSANLKLNSYETLMNDTSYNGPVVIPKYPERSILIDKIANETPAFGSRMPINLPPLDEEDIRTIETWIYYGAEDN